MSATLGSTSKSAMLLTLSGSPDPAIRANAGELTDLAYWALDYKQACAERTAERNRAKSALLREQIRGEAEGLVDRFDRVQVVRLRMWRWHKVKVDARTVRAALSENAVHPNVGMQSTWSSISPST